MIGGRLKAKTCASRIAWPLALAVAIAAKTEAPGSVRSSKGFMVTMAKPEFDLASPSRKL